MLQVKDLCYFCALLPLSYRKTNGLRKSQIHEAVYWQDTSNQTGRRWSVCSWNEQRSESSWKCTAFHLSSDRNLPSWEHTQVLGGAGYNTGHWGPSILSVTHSIPFSFNSFQEREKVTLFKQSVLEVSPISYQCKLQEVLILCQEIQPPPQEPKSLEQ